MDTNFIYTGGPFRPMYERAIRSAIATPHSDRTILWWNGERPNVDIPGLELQEYTPKLDVRAAVEARDLTSRPDLLVEHWMRVVTKDVIFWELAFERGGLFLDLDTFCLADVTELLGDYDVVSPIDVPWDPIRPEIGWRNVAVLITRKFSSLAGACLEATKKILTSGNMSYFELGPKVLTNTVHARGFDGIKTPPYRMMGGFGGGNEVAAYLMGHIELPAETRVVHWFSSSMEMQQLGIDPVVRTGEQAR